MGGTTHTPALMIPGSVSSCPETEPFGQHRGNEVWYGREFPAVYACDVENTNLLTLSGRKEEING